MEQKDNKERNDVTGVGEPERLPEGRWVGQENEVEVTDFFFIDIGSLKVYSSDTAYLVLSRQDVNYPEDSESDRGSDRTLDL